MCIIGWSGSHSEHIDLMTNITARLLVHSSYLPGWASSRGFGSIGTLLLIVQGGALSWSNVIAQTAVVKRYELVNDWLDNIIFGSEDLR